MKKQNQTKNKLFLRLETAGGCGVFQWFDYWDIFGIRNGIEKDQHPGPTRDPLLRHEWQSLYVKGKRHFGFKNLAQLKTWFKKSDFKRLIKLSEYQSLDGAEVVVSIYRAETFEGESQVVFNRSESKLIKKIAAADFLRMAYKVRRKAKKLQKTS